MCGQLVSAPTSSTKTNFAQKALHYLPGHDALQTGRRYAALEGLRDSDVGCPGRDCLRQVIVRVQLQLVIAQVKREKFGARSERSQST